MHIYMTFAKEHPYMKISPRYWCLSDKCTVTLCCNINHHLDLFSIVIWEMIEDSYFAVLVPGVLAWHKAKPRSVLWWPLLLNSSPTMMSSSQKTCSFNITCYSIICLSYAPLFCLKVPYKQQGFTYMTYVVLYMSLLCTPYLLDT